MFYSRLLLSIIDYLLKLVNEFAILLLLPCLVRFLDARLHLIQRLLEHLREVAMHCLNVCLEFSQLLLLLRLSLLNLRFNFLLLLC